MTDDIIGMVTHNPAAPASAQNTAATSDALAAQCKKTTEALMLHAPNSGLVVSLNGVLAELERAAIARGADNLTDADITRIEAALREAHASLHDIVRAEEFKKRIAKLVVGERGIEAADKIRAKAADLHSKYDASDYHMYHALNGSQPASHAEPSQLDFPNDDAVIPFVEEMEQEFSTGERT